MDKQEILDYVMNTPGNTNRAVLSSMLNSVSALEPITYSNLLAKRNSKNLVKGQQYRIIDYICTTTQPNTRAISHPFDIIVVADDESTLNECARACLHNGDNYYSSDDHGDVRIEAWELKYCLDNTETRFGWADPVNGKGIIYWLKDDHNNECTYDFKQIQFKRTINGTDQWLYTFSAYDSESDEIVYKDFSLYSANNGGSCYGNKISKCSEDFNYAADYASDYYLNDIVFNNILYEYCYDNVFGDNCYKNTFGTSCCSNYFRNNCYNNIFNDICAFNVFGSECNENTLDTGCSYNTFENVVSFIHMGEYSSSNTFGSESCFIDFFIDNGAQRYYVFNGVHGEHNNHLQITGSVKENPPMTYVAMNSGGTLKIWVPADNVDTK